jgi:hypothetical protein
MERYDAEWEGEDGVVFHDVEYVVEDFDRAARAYLGLFVVFLVEILGTIGANVGASIFPERAALLGALLDILALVHQL